MENGFQSQVAENFEREFSIVEAKHYAEQMLFRRSIIWWRTMVTKGHIKADLKTIHGLSIKLIKQTEIERVIKEQPHLTVTIKAIAFFIALSLPLLNGMAFAVVPDSVAVQTIMGEARGEGYEGMLAVAEVLRRKPKQPFYGKTAKFKEPERVWALARKAWKDSAHTNTTKGATHFEGSAFKVPYWAKKMKVVAIIGGHIFYK